MKYLSDYIANAQTDLFERLDIFFAFSDKQFLEGLEKTGRPKTDYASLGMGMLCPKENVEEAIHGLKQIVVRGIKQDIEENGLEAIIDRELANHEAWYTGEIDSTVDALEDYPEISVEMIQKRHALKYYDPETNENKDHATQENEAHAGA